MRCDTETAKSSEKDTTKMETIINDLKEKLSQEQDKCKRLQDDLSSYTERESKMSQSMTSVRIFFIFQNQIYYLLGLNGNSIRFFFRSKQVEQTKAKLDAEVKRLKKELENTKSTTSAKITDLTAQIAELKRESEKLTSQLDSETKAKETEITALNKKITSLEKAGQNTKHINEMKQTYSEKISSKVPDTLQN